MRPPRIYKFKNHRVVVIGNKVLPINSQLGDGKLKEEIEKGYEVESDDDNFILKEKDIEEPDNYKPLSHRGLYDNEINYIAKKLKLYKNGYLGTFPIDKIHIITKMISPGI